MRTVVGNDKSLLQLLVILLRVKSSLEPSGGSVSLPRCAGGNGICSSAPSPAKQRRRKPCGVSFPED